MASWAAVSAAASVELTSPETITRPGDSWRSTDSRRCMARGLLAVASRADAQEVVWSRHAEVVEEHLGHQPVVVLAGMDHDVPGEGQPPAESPQNGRHLDDVRAGADHVGESHGEIPISAGPAVHAGLK